MKPSDGIIEKFQGLYFEELGEELSREEASEKFLRLVNLLKVILRPTSQKDQEVRDFNSFPFEFDQASKNDKLKEHR